MVDYSKVKIYSRKKLRIYTALITLINCLGLKHSLTEYRCIRYLYGGTWYLVWNWLPINPFWSDNPIIYCGGRSIKIEIYTDNNLNF